MRRLPSALTRSLHSRDRSGEARQIGPGTEVVDDSRLRERLMDDGVATIEGLLPIAVCERVYRELLRQLDSAARPELGHIHGKDRRLDLPLRMTGAIADALVSLVDRLAPVLTDVLGLDASLVELSAIQSLPGASEQPPHPDAAGSNDPDEARLVTVFVLLSDVTRERGPLEVWPGSHAPPGKPDRVDELQRRPSQLITGGAGKAVLMDARTWHRGTANLDCSPRPVFYTSWLSPGTRPDGPTWSMHASIPTSLTLRALTQRA